MPTPQRLPIVNADDGAWGDIINQYLKKEHYDDATDNAVNGGHQKITVRAGTATAGTAPLKFTTGTNLTTAEAGAMEYSSSVLYFTPSGTTRQTVLLDLLPDSQNIAFGTTTGTKIGTATTQKIGFYNATPVVQQTGDIVTALSNLGLVTSGTVTPTGAVILAPTNSTTNIIQPTGDFKPLIVKGNASQTVTLQEWQNSGGTLLASVSSAGLGTFPNLNVGTATGKLSVNNSALGSLALDVYAAAAGSLAIYQTNGATAGDTIIGATLGNTVTGNVYGFKTTGTTNSGNLNITIQQGGNGAANFDALITGTGDAQSTYGINGGQAWAVGLDNSDSDVFAISSGGVLGTNNALRIDTSLNLTTYGDITVTEAKNIVLGTTTGTKIGTSTSQKLGFFNATPVVQQSSDINALVTYGLLASYSNETFTKEVAATIKVADTVTAATAGAALSIAAGAGSPTTSGAGGAASVTGGAGQAGNSNGGAVNLTGGVAAGIATGGAVNITGGSGLTGGSVVINAGNGVADGNVRLVTTDGMVAVGHTSTPGAMLDVRGRIAATDALSVDNVAIAGNIAIFKDNGNAVWTIADGGILTAADAIDIAVGTTTGTKIGTSTSQKLGFFNTTPIVQPANTVAINDLLVNLGLRASGGAANFTTTVQPRAGTTGAGTAPIKLTSGSLMTSPEAGAIEFLTDTLYFTQTTSTTRKKIAAYDDASGGTGDIHYRDSSGYLVRLGIGSGNQVLGVSGGLPAWAQAIFATATKTGASYTITSSDTVIIADATSNGVTITLPVASGLTGYRFYIKRKDATANTVSIARSGSDTIDGATSQTLDAQYTSATVVSDGSNWYII